jgi:hypothetical protein
VALTRSYFWRLTSRARALSIRASIMASSRIMGSRPDGGPALGRTSGLDTCCAARGPQARDRTVRRRRSSVLLEPKELAVDRLGLTNNPRIKHCLRTSPSIPSPQRPRPTIPAPAISSFRPLRDQDAIEHNENVVSVAHDREASGRRRFGLAHRANVSTGSSDFNDRRRFVAAAGMSVVTGDHQDNAREHEDCERRSPK